MKCSMCGKDVRIVFSGRFTDDPEDNYGYSAWVCSSCMPDNQIDDLWCSGSTLCSYCDKHADIEINIADPEGIRKDVPVCNNCYELIEQGIEPIRG